MKRSALPLVRRIGFGSYVFETEPLAGSAEGASSVASSLFGHGALNADAEFGVVDHRRFRKATALPLRSLFLISA